MDSNARTLHFPGSLDKLNFAYRFNAVGKISAVTLGSMNLALGRMNLAHGFKTIGTSSKVTGTTIDILESYNL